MSDDYYIHNDTVEVLTPSYHGELCRNNGASPDYEIACDECDYYLACFTELESVLWRMDMKKKKDESK